MQVQALAMALEAHWSLMFGSADSTGLANKDKACLTIRIFSKRGSNYPSGCCSKVIRLTGLADRHTLWHCRLIFLHHLFAIFTSSPRSHDGELVPSSVAVGVVPKDKKHIGDVSNKSGHRFTD